MFEKIRCISIFLFICLLIFNNTGCRKEDSPEILIPEVVTNEIKLVSAGIYKSYVINGKVISEGGSSVISRGICWSTNQSPDVSGNIKDSGTGSGEFYGLIDGKDLKSETTYYVRAYATNIKGTGYGEEQSFTTPCRLVNQSDPIVIECKLPVNGSENQYLDLTLHWDVYAIAYFSYNVLFGTKPNPDSVIARDLTRGYYEVKKLKLNTTYYWKVIAKDQNAPCQDTISPVFSFKTVKEVNAPTVITKAVSFFRSDYAILSGEIISDGGMPLNDFGLFWGEFPEPEKTGTRISRNSVNMTNSKLFSAVVTNGISFKTHFYVKAFAENSSGISFGEQIQFVTESTTSNIISDKEGNNYQTVTIGNQVWMADNLKSTRFNDESIMSTGWPTNYNDLNPAYCVYGTNPDNSHIYGNLYNWYAVKTGNLCPTGWHVPSKDEFVVLENYMISNGYNYDGSLTGNKVAKALAAPGLWSGSNSPGSPGYPDNNEYINKSGFSAHPAGSLVFISMDVSYYMFSGLNNSTSWWSSTESDGYSYIFNIQSDKVSSSILRSNRKNGYSVRCVKD